MATRELAFGVKIKNLKEYVHQIVAFSHSPPHGQDISNTLKYFTNSLLSILKDTPNIEGEKFYGAKHSQSNVRQAIFPTLNYSGLFDVVSQLLPVAHLVKAGSETFMASLLQLVTCIVSFITWPELVQLPYKFAMMIPVAEAIHHEELVRILCVHMLPNTLARDVYGNEVAIESVSGILMIVLQYCDDPKLHSMLVETLLPLCKDLYKHLFTVLAYGTPNTVIPAVSLLFHYWPQLNRICGANPLIETYAVLPWTVPICQRTNCINKVAKPSASKICTDPNMCVSECQAPPPVFICVDCFDTIGMRSYDESFSDLVMPTDHISIVCSNKNCSSVDKKAAHVCTSNSCVRMNRFKPVSLCTTCHQHRHPADCGFVQNSIENIWTLDLETQSYIVDGIVNLLRQGEPPCAQVDPSLTTLTDDHIAMEKRNDPINSRYGILMLKELCKPRDELSVDSLGRLLGMLFRWFQCTSSSANPNISNLLDRLKTEFMTDWLQEVKKSHYEVILSTLLPHPPDFAKVGGQWERLSSRTEQMKEGLEKLIMLGPYDIVTYEVWDYIMPYWLESIRTELSMKERDEIKTVLRQTFDIEMSPLPFLLDKMYHFVDERFESPDPLIQEQGLQWLQILTSVDIAIPYITLLKIFQDGTVVLLSSNTISEGCDRSASSVKLNCAILELDILLKQTELNKQQAYSGITLNKSKEMFILVYDMIKCIKGVEHEATCQRGAVDCECCQHMTVFYQLVFNLIRLICPRLESSLAVCELKSTSSSAQANNTGDSVDSADTPVIHKLFSALVKEVDQHYDPDIIYYIVCSLKNLFVHGQCLQFVYKTYPQLVNQFLKEEFIPLLWRHINGKDSRTSKMEAMMLFHAITIGEGHNCFWAITDSDFCSTSWQTRYAVVDKVRMIWEYSNANFLAKNQLLQTSLAHVFCHFIALLHDADHHVAQRANLYLRLISDSSLKAFIMCLAIQFDAMLKDRQLVLQCISQLQNAIPDRVVISWSFLLARLQLVLLEAEMVDSGMGGKGTLTKLNQGVNLDYMMKMAAVARQKPDHLLSIKEHSGIYKRSTVAVKYGFTSSAPKDKDRRFISSNLLKHKGRKKHSSAFSDTGTIFESMSSLYGSSSELSYIQHMLAKFKDMEMCESNEAGKLIEQLHRAIEHEKLDHSLLHLMVVCIMKFMSRVKVEMDDKERAMMEATTERIFHLLGYSEGRFYVLSANLRTSPIIDAVLSNLAKCLDTNVTLGQKMLLDWLNVLKFVSSPQKYASDTQPADYTLLHLPRSLYKPWVDAVLIILYKYNYSKLPKQSDAVNYVVQIVLNTLTALHHQCKQTDADQDGGDSLPVISPRDISAVEEEGSEDEEGGFKQNNNKAPSTIMEESECGTPSHTLPKHVIKAKITKSIKLGSRNNNKRADAYEKAYKAQLKKTSKKNEISTDFTSFAEKLSNPQGTKPTKPMPGNSKMSNPQGTKPTDPMPENSKISNPQGTKPTDPMPGNSKISNPQGTNPASPIPESSKMSNAQGTKPTDPMPENFKISDPQGTKPTDPMPGNPNMSNPQGTKPTDTMPENSKMSNPQGTKPTDPMPGNSKISNPQGTNPASPIPESSKMSNTQGTKPTDPMPENFKISNPQGTKPTDPMPGNSKMSNPQVMNVTKPMPGNSKLSSPQGTKPTKPMPGISKMSNPQGTKTTKPIPGNSKMDFADLLSNPQGPTTTKNKNPKLLRQFSIESNSGHSAVPVDHKANPVQAFPEDVIATLENPQTSSVAETSFNNRSGKDTKAVDVEAEVGFKRKDAKEAKEAKDQNSRKDSRFGNMLNKMKRQPSRRDVLRDSHSEEDMTQTFQSVAAATDFMARSKRNRGADGHSFGPIKSPSSNLLVVGTDEYSKVCSDCNKPIEEYDEDVIVTCIVIAEAYLNHDIDQAAGMVYQMVHGICRIANKPIYSWQDPDRPTFIPGNVVSAAHQFLRCSLHHLLSYKIMSELLVSSDDSSIFPVIVLALADFAELTGLVAILTALEGINEKEEIKKVYQLVENLHAYFSALSTDLSQSQEWVRIVDQLEILFRKIQNHLPSTSTDMSILLKFMHTIMKMPITASNVRGDRLVETFGKLISVAIQNHTFCLPELAKLSQMCYRIFGKDRDKYILSKILVNELLQVIKYKSIIPESNVLMLVEIICMDCGSTLLPTYITNEIPNNLTSDMIIETGICDVMKCYLHDCIEFISDLHALQKLKGHMKLTCLHEDTFGGLLKTGIAQIVALIFSKLIGGDAKAIQRVLPWFYNQPNTLQRGPREFIESVDHLRFLCWLYIGALTHHAVAENVLSTKCQPLPLDDANNVSVIVMSIMTGFVEYSALSVEFMSSLFYAFNLCQVWTMYCDCLTEDGLERVPEEKMDISQLVFDFWAKVTPTILNIMSHSRVLAEMVNIHTLTMMETLQVSNSSVLVKLFPLWRLLLYANQSKLATNVRVRLQTIENWQPSTKKQTNKAVLFDWIKKVQFKLAQIEVQSSTAATKFLPV